MKTMLKRGAGVLMPIFSLPSPYGIGTFGRAAYEFIDQLKRGRQTYWQVLPMGPTCYGDSPYQSYSAFAGNPYFIDLDTLKDEKLLTQDEIDACWWCDKQDQVKYDALYYYRFPLLRKAYERSGHKESVEYQAFLEENEEWLDDYALYMAVKGKYEGKGWMDWDEDIRFRRPEALSACREELAEEINYWKFLQFKFFEQWKKLKQYAKEKELQIVGDIPIYVALDSADVWSHPELFQLDEENLTPLKVSGVPPDAFSEDGQLWGNPLYRWDVHRNTGFEWWMKRLAHCFNMYDVVRIDHFRGFDEYYAIPYGDKTAERGWWEKGPGMDLFRTVSQRLGQKDIIAEDLGFMTDSVKRLVEESGYPNMKVIEFAFDARDTGNASDYLPHNYTNNCVVYTGTHDNETLLGWYSDITPEERHMVREYLWNFHDDEKGICRNMIRLVMGSAAGRCIIPIQDYLQLDNTARINQPSTLGINWKWRLTEGQFTKELQKEMLALVTRFGRRNWTPDPVEEEDEEKEEA